MRLYAGRRLGRHWHGGVSFSGWWLLWGLLWVPALILEAALRVLAGEAAPFWKLMAGLLLAFCVFEFFKWFVTTP